MIREVLTVSPLTLALSPLKGEGTPGTLSFELRGLSVRPGLFREERDASRDGRNYCSLSPQRGEVGVRGESANSRAKCRCNVKFKASDAARKSWARLAGIQSRFMKIAADRVNRENDAS
jgi:hypothetical protein